MYYQPNTIQREEQSSTHISTGNKLGTRSHLFYTLLLNDQHGLQRCCILIIPS